MTRAHGLSRAASLLAVTLPATLLLMACGGTDEPQSATAPDFGCQLPAGPVVIAGTARSNMPAAPPTGGAVRALDRAIEAGAWVAVYDADSMPDRKAGASSKSDAQNPEAKKADTARFRQGVLDLLAGEKGHANAPEADPLTALGVAASDARAHGNGTGTVVLVDNGLQTSGVLQYQSGSLLLASGADVVGSLRAQNQLPNLSGVTVVLTGLGATAAPQQPLDTASKSRLVEQWTEIANASGATCVAVDEEPLTGPTPTSVPAVSAVPVPKPPQPKLDPHTPVPAPVPLREDAVGFKMNSATLRDPAAARDSVSLMAAQIIAGGGHVTLTGTTATDGTPESRRKLSLQRAEAVKQLLIAAGVRADLITTAGVGTDHPQHVQDLDAAGKLIPEKAMQNRAVFLEVTQ